MNHRRPLRTCFRLILAGAAVLVLAGGCKNAPIAVPSVAATAGTGSGSSPTAAGPSPSASAEGTASAGPSASQEPDTGTTSGDVPDNAVFLTYKDPKLGYSVQYVEGWQVSPTADGVTIRDKDSSEVIGILPVQMDVTAFVAGTDLTTLGQQPGFHLVKQDTVAVGGNALVHLVYDVLSAPDPVTGKQVPSTVDRYYVPGTSGLAVISLATPKGVDNVDAFRQMIQSFRWMP